MSVVKINFDYTYAEPVVSGDILQSQLFVHLSGTWDGTPSTDDWSIVIEKAGGTPGVDDLFDANIPLGGPVVVPNPLALMTAVPGVDNKFEGVPFASHTVPFTADYDPNAPEDYVAPNVDIATNSSNIIWKGDAGETKNDGFVLTCPMTPSSAGIGSISIQAPATLLNMGLYGVRRLITKRTCTIDGVTTEQIIQDDYVTGVWPAC